MRLFKEVLIETAEQAEALPGGTIAFHGTEAGRSTACRIPPIAALGGADFGWDTYSGRVANAAMVGWTALVPIEAEEETMWEDSAYFQTQTRLVTPWEEA